MNHPDEVWWISLIKSAVIINLVMVAFAYTTWLERKLLGRMQNRYGPNRAGPYGLLQPFADLIKLVRKESFFPVEARDRLYILAPIIAMFTALAAFAVIPFGSGWDISGWHVDGVIANVSIGLILLFALVGQGWIALLEFQKRVLAQLLFDPFLQRLQRKLQDFHRLDHARRKLLHLHLSRFEAKG